MEPRYSNGVTNTGGLGFAGALTILFVALKLTDVIDWPWLWVVSPIWISVLIVVVFMIAIGVGFVFFRRR